jgi:hypothetical protein
MAITIKSSPSAYSSANKGLYHVVTSSNSTQPNFKFVFDVLINNITIASIKLFADSGGYGVFDATEIIRQYFQTGFISNASGITMNNYDFISCTYKINYGEEYGGTTYTNLTNATTTVYNYVNDPFLNGISSFQNKFLTNRDKNNIEVGFGENYYITYFNTSLSNVTATIQKINSDGSNDGYSVTTSSLGSARSILMNFCATNINTSVGSSFITSSTYGYKVTIGSDTITIVHVCNTRFNNCNMVFLNMLGGYETFTFRLASRRKKNAEQFTYSIPEYIRSGDNMITSINGVTFGGKRSYGINTTTSYTAVSDYLSEQDYNLGAEIITSPETYFQIGALYYPMILKQTNWTQKLQSTDKIFNYEFEFDLSYNLRSQIR